MTHKLYQEPYVQQRMVNAIVSNGGEADSRKIRELTGMKFSQISKGGQHLKNRGIVKKRNKGSYVGGYPENITIYSLADMGKVDRLLKQLPEEWK